MSDVFNSRIQSRTRRATTPSSLVPTSTASVTSTIIFSPAPALTRTATSTTSSLIKPTGPLTAVCAQLESPRHRVLLPADALLSLQRQMQRTPVSLENATRAVIRRALASLVLRRELLTGLSSL